MQAGNNYVTMSIMRNFFRAKRERNEISEHFFFLHDEAYKKVPQGRFSGFDANEVFLIGAKTALTIFLKFCTPPYFDPNFLMKKFLDP